MSMSHLLEDMFDTQNLNKNDKIVENFCDSL